MTADRGFPIIDRTGQHIWAKVPGEGTVSGVVSHSSGAPTHGETQHIIGEPDDGRRAIAVLESQVEESLSGEVTDDRR